MTRRVMAWGWPGRSAPAAGGHLPVCARADCDIMPAVERTRAKLGGVFGACALLFAVASGCGPLLHRSQAPTVEAAPPPSPRPEEPTPLGPPAATDFATLTQHLASTLTGAGASCARVAFALDAWTAAYGDAYRAAIRAIDAWEATADREDVKAYYDELFDAIRARVDAGSRCDADQGTRAAFARFFEAVGFAEVAP